MYHRPVCTKCEVEFTPTRNGVNVVDYNDNGPYTISEADEWTCPECGFQIIRGFGDPSLRRSDDGIERLNRFMAKSLDHNYLRKNYGDIQTKAKNEGKP